jgi:hypothetical protein
MYLMIYNIVLHCSLKYRDFAATKVHVTNGSDMAGVRQELMMMMMMMMSNILEDL